MPALFSLREADAQVLRSAVHQRQEAGGEDEGSGGLSAWRGILANRWALSRDTRKTKECRATAAAGWEGSFAPYPQANGITVESSYARPACHWNQFFPARLLFPVC